MRRAFATAAVVAIAFCAGSQKVSAGSYYDGWDYRPWNGYAVHAWSYGAPLAITQPYASYGYGLAFGGCYRRLTWVQTIYYGIQQAWVTQCY